MQTAVEPKKETKKSVETESAPAAGPRIQLKEETAAEAGVPLYLQNSSSLSKSSPPPIQRQPMEEEEEPLQTSPIAPPYLQAKLTIGEPNDEYEQEADRVADQVMRMPESQETPSLEEESEGPGGSPGANQTKPVTPSIQRQADDEEEEVLQTQRAAPPYIQRMCTGCKEELTVQKKAPPPPVQTKGEKTSSLSGSVDIAKTVQSPSGGSPLSDSVKNRIEPVLNANLSHVRVHNDTKANDAAHQLNSKAFTNRNNIFMGRGQSADSIQLMAHESTHVMQQAAVDARVQRFTGPASERRSARTQAGSADLVPYVPGILREQYPHLLKVLGGSELKSLQASVDAYARYTKARERRIAFEKKRIHVSDRGYGGGSSDVARWRRLKAVENRENAATGRDTVFRIDARLMLADDVRNGNTTNPTIDAYHKALYKRVTELPMVIAAKPKLAFNAPGWDQFLSLRWGPNAWMVGHDKGLVRFRHLMAAQNLNLEYTQIVLGEQIKVMDKLIALKREMGEHYNVEGRKLGEFDSGFWDIAGTDVFIGYESQSTQDLLGGYVNDATGRFQMTKDLYAKRLSKRSRVVLLSPGNWLHIYPTKPQFWSQQLTDEGDGYRYLNTARGDRSLNIQQIITSDARALHFAKSRNATGWRTENELSGVEQFAIGVILGDAFEQSSGWAAFGQIITGLIPVVGQVADARDVAIGVHKIWTTGGKQGKLQTAFAMLGFVPFLGDAIKSSFKGGGKEVAEQAVDTVSKQIGGGVSESAGRQIRETAEKSGRDDAADLVGRKAEDVRAREGAGRGGTGSIRQAVRESASESAATGEAAFAATREAADDVTSALGHRLPDLHAPGLVDQLPVKLAGESHTMKVVQLGGWKQLWLCSECSSLIGLVDDAIAAGGKASDDLIRLRRRLKDLEWKLNAGKLSEKRLRGQLRAASSALERIARHSPDLAGLQPFLAKRFDAAWVRRYPKQMPDAAKAAKGKGYPPPPPDHHWVDNQGQLYVRRNKGATGPELRYDPLHKHFVTPDKAGRTSLRFGQEVDGQAAFDLLGGNDAKSSFGRFVKALSDELGVTKKELVAELDARSLAGASHDTIRSALKEPYRRRLMSRLTDSARLTQTATYKKALAETANPRVAERAASFEEFLEISRKLGPADKGSLGETWYQHWFAHRGADVGTQSKLGAAQGLKEVRRLDIYEDHLTREVKNVTTAMGTKEADQLRAQVSAIGKTIDVKVAANQTIKSGYDSIRYAFLDPAGAKINAGWIVDQLQLHSKANLSFQILNKRGKPLVVSPTDLARLGPDGLKRRIVGWVE